MSIEEAIKIIKEQLPNVKLTSVVPFEGKYIFRLDNSGKGSGGLSMMSVNNDGKVHMVDMADLFDKLDDFEEASKNEIMLG